ncbi:MAG: PAS domain-containing sensor histidine kinase [Chloroflexota bacterium]|nr:PAS domain-containing sensor histidine kinase [Chloroflexota bacterium]
MTHRPPNSPPNLPPAASDDLLAQIFAHNPAVQWLSDPQTGRIVDANPAAATFYGYSVAQLRGMPVAVINTRPAVEVQAEMVQALSTGRTYFVFQHRLASGAIRDVEVHTGPVTLAGRRLLYSIIQDITERRQAEATLRRQNAELATLQATTLDLIHRLDPDSLLEVVVTQAGTLVGTEHGYIYVVEPDRRELVIQVGIGRFAANIGYRLAWGVGLAGRVAATGEPLAVDDYLTWAGRQTDLDSMQIHALVGIPLWSGDQVAGVIGLAYLEPNRRFSPDAVALLRHFSQLASLALVNARLYNAVQSELQERRQIEDALLEAKEAAEAASRAKSAFLANMSHELRTPLNAIIGYSEMLIDEAAEEGFADLLPDLDKIRSAGSHLLGLINDVLDLSKIEADRMTAAVQPFDLADLIKSVVGVTLPLVERNDNRLVVAMAPDLGVIHSDPLKLRQILINLLSNAGKFTQDGVVTLTVGRDPAADWIACRVTDTGIGMTPGEIAALFQPFMQADTSSTRRYGGTGLGLALSRRLCELLGGTIQVASTPGAGSTFTVHLPAQLPPGTRSERTLDEP